MAYSRKEKGLFGDEKMVHYDDNGRKVGESRAESSLFGGEKNVHYDERGQKVGESKKEETIFGDKRIRHYGSQKNGTKMEAPNKKEHGSYRAPSSNSDAGSIIFLLLGLPLIVVAAIALSVLAWSTMDTTSDAGRIMGPVTISSAIVFLVLGVYLSVKFKGFGEVSPFAYGATMWLTMYIADAIVEGAGEHPVLGFLCAGIYSFLFAIPGIGALAIMGFVRSEK